MLPLLLLFPLSIHGQVFDKVLVSLGRGAETDSEVIAVGETNCDKPLEYPLLTEGAVGDVIHGQAVICGGKFFGVSNTSCGEYKMHLRILVSFFAGDVRRVLPP